MGEIIDLSKHMDARNAKRTKEMEAMEVLIKMAREYGEWSLVEDLERMNMEG